MRDHSPAQLTLNPTLAAEAHPGLEKIAQELQQCLDQLETLQNSFRENFLKLFSQADPTPDKAREAGPALANVFFFHQANLGGNAVSHLRYAADLANLACGLLADAKSAEN